eukprot:TRINITY_DN1588_c0_g3_i1.p1 TRINITY_DN1588_c0_g3~~TRINITY_DN1588_c0_g3_i1.p1  ORF type:complete len:113 (+),score=11.93 TRINITY_DN1588_c0_g3_i1:53-391(+)
MCAGRAGDLDILQWLRAQGCPWDGRICAEAVVNGHLELLQWARANGCPWNGENLMTLDFLVWVDGTCSKSLVNALSAVEWALANGCPCSDNSRAEYMQLRRRVDAAQVRGPL